MKRKITAMFLAFATILMMITAGCASDSDSLAGGTKAPAEAPEETGGDPGKGAGTQNILNLACNEDQTWTYLADSDAWVLSAVCAVSNPEIEEKQGVSVCVPGAYVKGIDTDGDGRENVSSSDDSGTDGVRGSLVIDYETEIPSSNGQIYTAASAPVIINTGAAGYGSATNSPASDVYASEGYINVACGNRGKQDTVTDENGNTEYTGDAPCCLVDQKNAIRYVKYNILLGNLPGSVDCFVSTGGSGGGAHAVMVAATGNNPDFYDYEIEAGAAGISRTDSGYSTSVTIEGKEYSISDGVWGCMAYSAITSLADADMAMAFEYTLDTDYEFNTDFQAQMAKYLSEEYREYINGKNLSVKESDFGFDLNKDGDRGDEVALTIDYDPDRYADTNGYGGTYLTLYLEEFESNLQKYLDNLAYAQGWTWFHAGGTALSDEEAASMTDADRAEAFLEGRYAKGAAAQSGPSGGMPSGNGPQGVLSGGMPPVNPGTPPDGGMPEGQLPGKKPSGTDGFSDNQAPGSPTDSQTAAGTPDTGTTQGRGSGLDSAGYSSFEEMLESYRSDIESIEAGDKYGKNIVGLYNPLNYIGAEGTQDAVWTRIVCGAVEGDISMFNSLNLQIAMRNAGTDCEIEWQWDGGHVPSEILGDSFSLYVDEMYRKYAGGAVEITKKSAEPATANGNASEPAGTDLRSWVDGSDLSGVSFSLADAVSYRTGGASKAVPGFDVMDYGQEDYVFGNREKDARHWDRYVLNVLENHSDELAALWNKGQP